MNKVKYLKLNVDTITSSTLQMIKQNMALYPDRIILVNLENTKNLFLQDVESLMKNFGYSRVKVRIVGGYDDERVMNYTAPIHVDMHKHDNIYSLAEMKLILLEIEKIEKDMNPNWTQEQKFIYFVGYLKNKIIYHPFFEKMDSPAIRSLRGLYSHKTVCAGYAMILKELCDRHGIGCQYVEGACNKEDSLKGYLTHAWNIVTLGGYSIPVDLTWTADKSHSGKSLSLEDMANVNEFVKSHIPGKYEKIQDYERTLKSLDGTYLRIIDNLINKDRTYDNSMMLCTRANGEKFVITQVREEVVGNEYLYSYVYTKFLGNGEFGHPMLFYSKTNVALILARMKRKSKLEDQLIEAEKRHDTKKVEELRKELEGSEYLPTFSTMVDDLLFSKVNMTAALKRGDYYLGEIKMDKSSGKKGKIDGVVVDPNFCKKREERQRTILRSDGTSFVLETYGTVTINNYKVNRYKMFEIIKEKDGSVLKKNTIFSDEDLMVDYRSGIANDFLARSRVDRKAKETGGYLGYYSDKGIRTYVPAVNEVFYSGIYKYFAMKPEHIKNYYADLTFEDMKRLVCLYDMEIVAGKEQVVNRYTHQVVVKDSLIKQVRFAILWLRSAGIKYYQNDPVPGYGYAFEVESAKQVFEVISKCIQDSINKFGIIDPVDILHSVKKECGLYKYAETIVINMFNSEKAIDIVRSLYMLQNPGYYEKQKELAKPLYNLKFAIEQMVKRNEELIERKKQMLEVVEENGRVEMKPYRR